MVIRDSFLTSGMLTLNIFIAPLTVMIFQFVDFEHGLFNVTICYRLGYHQWEEKLPLSLGQTC